MLGSLIVGQLEFYWDAHLWPRLAGLTDEEYFWEPVAGCWSVRRGEDGTYRLETRSPEPQPAPFTTIAWRMVHIGQAMATRTNTFFPHGSDTRVSAEPGPDMFDPSVLPADVPATAATALTFIEREYRAWRDALATLDDEQLWAPLGPRGNVFANDSMAALVMHVNREVMHHGGEIGVLRDLYRDGYSA